MFNSSFFFLSFSRTYFVCYGFQVITLTAISAAFTTAGTRSKVSLSIWNLKENRNIDSNDHWLERRKKKQNKFLSGNATTSNSIINYVCSSVC